MVRKKQRRVSTRGAQKSGVLRPSMTVLPSDALIPAPNFVEPPPKKFTHELTRDEPFHFGKDPLAAPDGELCRGTPVVLVTDDGHLASVIDERGLCVLVRTSSLRAIGE